MRRYHVILTDDSSAAGDGAEVDFNAANLAIRDGALIFVNDVGDVIRAYAPGQWALVEVGRMDDKG